MKTDGKLQSALKSPRFQRLKLVGRGAAGDVYAADDVILSRRVAIKEYRDLSQSTPHLERALKLCAKLRHPGIVQVIDIIRTEDSLRLVQTYCENGSLAALLADGSTDEIRVADLFSKICDAVSHMHDRDILHCDLKLANILYGPHGEPVLIDFDLCCEIGSQEKRPLSGTPAYMAPELTQQSASPSVASEVYALGVILYELLTGRLISETASVSELLLQDDSAFQLSDSALPRQRDWNAILNKAIHCERTKRYESVAALASDVRNLIEYKPLLARRIGRVERLKRWGQRNRITTILATAATCFLLVGVSASFLAWGRAAAMRTRAEEGQIALVTQIGQTQRAKSELETLVAKVRQELDAAKLAETQQTQLTAKVQRAELDLQTAATTSAQLAAELNAALQQATHSEQAVAKLDEQRITALSSLEAARVNKDSVTYLNLILDAHKAQQDSRWEEASAILEKTSPASRGIEYNMLQAAIKNKLLEPELVVVGRLKSSDQKIRSSNWSPVKFEMDSSVRYLEGRTEYFYENTVYRKDRKSRIPVIVLRDPDATLLEIQWEANTYEPFAITSTGDILVRMKVLSGAVEIGVITFAPMRYQANSGFISDRDLEHLMQQAVIFESAVDDPPSETRPEPSIPSKPLLNPASLKPIQWCVWEKIGQPLQFLGELNTTITPLPNHSIALGTNCQSIAVSSTGLLASCDQLRRVSVIDIRNPNAEPTLVTGDELAKYLAFDASGLCYISQPDQPPSAIQQMQFGRNDRGDVITSPLRLILPNPQGPWGMSIPTWFDPNHLYLTNHLSIERLPLPLASDSQRTECFRIIAPGFWTLSSCMVSDGLILMTVGSSATEESTGAASVGYATLLFDRHRRGFYVLDRIIETATKTPDGRTMLFVDDDGILKQLAWQSLAENSGANDSNVVKTTLAEQVSESVTSSTSSQNAVPESGPAGYFRLEIVGRNVDVHSLKLSTEGLRSVKNQYAWPVFEVNGQSWEPENQPLLSEFGSSQLLPPNLNFSAAKIQCVLTGSWVDTQYVVSSESLDIAYIDQPSGAGDCCTIISIPFTSTVAEDMSDMGVKWNEPWSTSLVPLASEKKEGKWEPPTREMISTMQAKANFQFEKLDFVFWDNPMTEDPLTKSGRNQGAFPKDYFVLTGQRSFECPAGVYSLESFADDGIRVWIDDTLRIDDWKHQNRTRHQTQEIQLAAGEHVVRFEYYEETGLSRLFVNVRRVE